MRKRIKCLICGKIRYEEFDENDLKNYYHKTEPCNKCEKFLIRYLIRKESPNEKD